MAQDDLVIANQTFPATRTDLNSNLQALGSLMSGASAPGTTYAYMWWADTTNGVLKQRDASNAAWVIRATLSDDRVVNKTGTYTIVLGDFGKFITCGASGGAFSINLLAAATALDGFEITIVKTDSTVNAITIDGSGAETINGATTYLLERQWDKVTLICDGSNWNIKSGASFRMGGAPETTVASAATTDLASALSNYVTVSGTTTITAFGSNATLNNPYYFVRFTGALQITHNASSMICPWAVNININAGDVVLALYLGSGNWRIVKIFREGGYRERLTADRTYYVLTTGADTNSGLANTAGGAFLTIQKAVDVARDRIDFGGFTVTIQVGAGTYTGSISVVGKFTGQNSNSNLLFVGDTATPTNVVLSTTSADIFAFSRGAMANISGFKLQTTTSGDAISATDQGTRVHCVTSGSMNFGAIAGVCFNCNAGGLIQANINYTISGSHAQHINCGSYGRISITGITVTLTGTPAWGVGAAMIIIANGYVNVSGVTWTGAATGARYTVTQNGVLYTNGQLTTWLPGNAAHATPTATQGQYL